MIRPKTLSRKSWRSRSGTSGTDQVEEKWPRMPRGTVTFYYGSWKGWRVDIGGLGLTDRRWTRVFVEVKSVPMSMMDYDGADYDGLFALGQT